MMEKIDNKPIDVVDLMQRFTLDVLGKTVFDFDFNILPLDLILYFKNRSLGKVKKLQKLFDDFIKNKHKSMAAGKSNGDLLELMIKACDDPNNEGFNDIELRNVQQKAREEILSVLGSDLTPSTEQHKALKYLNISNHSITA
ncbi:2594_t:CDS:2 [Gigaspora rosea]|nr:2594_t:CDS:2 [Gigaspora rosea]